MTPDTIHPTLFYLWWLLVNGFVYYSEFRFLQDFSNTHSHNRSFGMLYLISNSVFTLLSIVLKLPSLLSELLHVALLFLFSLFFLRCRPIKTIAPVLIIFTLSTFLNSISTVLLRFASSAIPYPTVGLLLQVLLSAGLALLFYWALRLIQRRYRFTAQEDFSSYLYVLLLPCAFVVWVLRYGLGLDSPTPQVSSQMLFGGPLALICIAGALATFVGSMEIFAKIVALANHKTNEALLNDQLREQQRYLAEAKHRNLQYRSYQHDIENHMIVLSGLLREGKFTEAEQYLHPLHLASRGLLSQLATGNSALDILLSEKIQYAQQQGIAVTHSLHLPKDSTFPDIDLCVLFSNALDNAICACAQVQKERRSIQILAKVLHQFLLIELVNSTADSAPAVFGTGLTNMQQIAEKYQGALELQNSGGLFRLSILLCQKQPPA